MDDVFDYHYFDYHDKNLDEDDNVDMEEEELLKVTKVKMLVKIMMMGQTQILLAGPLGLAPALTIHVNVNFLLLLRKVSKVLKAFLLCPTMILIVISK